MMGRSNFNTTNHETRSDNYPYNAKLEIPKAFGDIYVSRSSNEVKLNVPRSQIALVYVHKTSGP